MDTISAMEKIETDNKDRPLEDILILNTEVFLNPFEEVDAAIKAEREAQIEKPELNEERINPQKSKVVEYKAVKSSGVGKYLIKRKWFLFFKSEI